MDKILVLIAIFFSAIAYTDPGIMIDIDIIFERPSGPDGGTLGVICK